MYFKTFINFTTIASIAFSFMFASSCRRDAPDLMSELPLGSGSSRDNSFDGVKTSSEEEIAFNAVSKGDIETLQDQISAGKVSIFSRSPSTGKSLLETAVMSGSLEIVDYLMELDGNVIYGELIYIINNSGLIDDATRAALIEKITTGEQSQQSLDYALMKLVENGMDDPLEPSDYNSLENLLFEKGADATYTDFFNLPVSSSESGSMRRLGVNLLYKALGCKEYKVEWIIEELESGEVEVELDYFDIDCSGIRKPNFVKLLIEAGADFTQKVVFFDEPTTFLQLLEELRDDFSIEEYEAIVEAVEKRQAPLYKALGCDSNNLAGNNLCSLENSKEISEGTAKTISELIAKGADPYYPTTLKGQNYVKKADFFQILTELRKMSKISENDYNSLLSITKIYK